MATYVEIRNLFNDGPLRNRVSTAVIIAAENMLTGLTPTAAQRAFALAVMTNPDVWGERVYKIVLAANSGASVAQIQGAPDTGAGSIQAAVDAVIEQIATAYSESLA